MSLGHTYKFFGFYISYTSLTLPLSIFYLSFMLLILCTFHPSLLTQISASKIRCCGLAPQPLPQKGSTLTLALTGFYCFSRPLTSKKVLLYYAKVCFGWLSLQTQERVSLNTSKEDICNVKGEGVQMARFHTWKV